MFHISKLRMKNWIYNFSKILVGKRHTIYAFDNNDEDNTML